TRELQSFDGRLFGGRGLRGRCTRVGDASARRRRELAAPVRRREERGRDREQRGAARDRRSDRSLAVQVERSHWIVMSAVVDCALTTVTPAAVPFSASLVASTS